MFLRDWLLIVAFWIGIPMPVAADAVDVSCTGQAVQGGLLLCNSAPGSTLSASGPDGEAQRDVPVNADGVATIGLLRNETAQLYVRQNGSESPPLEIEIAPRKDPFRTVEGFDCDKVDARTEEQKAHAADSWVKKQAAFKTFSTGQGASAGFLRPSEGPMSSPFGPERRYIGVGKDGQPCDKTSVHYGYDIAVPTGTEIVAPADGTIILGDADLYYEGGTVFLDHGDGLVSVFMHMSAVDVTAGDKVKAGDRLGASGNTGRTTGPHLHWAVKWRNSGTSDRSGDFYIAPALLLELEPLQ